ncbi:MAG: hypothetical protein SH857_10190 [Chitinophagales bacterium]|nr:hypothetical protein [Chitinophagales bacterium]
MKNEQKIKSSIINRLDKISQRKLKDVLHFIEKLENSSSDKSDILSFAGSWKEMDDSTFNDLTKHLHKRRKANTTRRIL